MIDVKGIWQRLTDLERNPFWEYIKIKRADTLIGRLKDDEFRVQSFSIIELKEIGAAAVPALIEAMKTKGIDDESCRVRHNAGVALSGIGRPAVPYLIRLLSTGSEEMRLYAVNVLGQITDASVFPPLVGALSDPDEKVRRNAARGLSNFLGKIGKPGKTIDKLGLDDLESSEDDIKGGFSALMKKNPGKDEIIKTKIQLAKLMKKIAEMKNGLAPQRDMLLEGRPKPPESGKMYHAMRRVRNG